MKVIIDSNVWISFLLGFQKEMMYDVLKSEYIDVYVCPQLLNEIKDVANRPKIRSRIADDDVEQLFRLIKAYCIKTNIVNRSLVPIRDSKDLYLLSLSETINADYIISGDKDLLDVEDSGYRIVSPSQFKMII